MPTLAPAPSLETVFAAQAAEKNWKRNLRALAASQSMVAQAPGEIPLDKEWVWARDGTLTAMEANGRWWGDCSVPLFAGRALLKTLQAGSAGSCLLAPGNAGMVMAARERIGPWTPLFVIQPDLDIAKMILACQDFSGQIDRHRLWLVCGADWPRQLEQIFTAYPGLATPVQFIRSKLSPEQLVSPVIAEAQDLFSKVVNERAQQIAEITSRPGTATDARQILIVGGNEFRLWEDGPEVLHQQLTSQLASARISVRRFDTDDPLCGSPLAFLDAAQSCGSVVSANLCRADSNHLISSEIPWITWMTQPGAPPFETAGRKDGLILADPAWREIARRAGWPEDRVKVCGWPSADFVARFENGANCLGLIANTRATEVPASVKQFSSHRLLWELVEEELRADPFVLQIVDDYLANRSGQLNIAGDALDRRAFVEQLIIPAYQQGLARVLLAAGIPLSIWGEGWGELEEFAAAARGPLADRQALDAAVTQSTALIYCWPEKSAHPIESVGKPLVHRAGSDHSQFIRNARRALTGGNRKPPGVTVDSESLAGIIVAWASRP